MCLHNETSDCLRGHTLGRFECTSNVINQNRCLEIFAFLANKYSSKLSSENRFNMRQRGKTTNLDIYVIMSVIISILIIFVSNDSVFNFWSSEILKM